MTASPRSEISDLKSQIGGSTAPVLPSPARTRWQPLRSGVLNLYRYDHEEFHYADGRLLLRGNNGSGKSRVLALQLPFLLDGEVSPARVEPDGDAAKRIEWNLLMGRHADRTGYTWIEFGRRDEAGVEHFLTLGCGLRAVAGHTGLHSRWFFITTRRVGRDLFLQNAQRTPLGRDRLAETLGADGQVFLKAEDYRRALDERLFGLGPRYGALIELLLRLRRPQLTRKLDENELPEALAEALPTLSSGIVDEVAESFRSLQADKDTLRDFQTARAAVAAFLVEYAAYVRIAVRRRAADLRTAHSGYESAQRTLKDAAARLDSAAAELSALAARHYELGTRLAGAETEERTLATSPEMRTADEIRLAGESAAAAATALDQARTDEKSAASAAELARARLLRAEEDAAAFVEKISASLRAVESAAESADLAAAHREALGDSARFDLADLASLLAAEPALDRIHVRRAQNLQHLRSGETALAALAASLAAAEHALREAESAAATAREEEHTARDTLAARSEALLAAYAAWQSAARRLHPASAADLAEAHAAWLEFRAGPGPLRQAAEAARAQTAATHAARRHALDQAVAELAASIRETDTEIARLERGDTPPPPPPPTRRAERRDRPGAPLWRVCDFRPEVAPAARAGLEAALQASGLLDAWLLPDGRLLTADEDTFLVAGGDESEISNFKSQIGTSLGDVLHPALDPDSPAARDLTPGLVARALASIGAARDQGPHWVAPDGSWRLGPLTGRWTKPEPEFIGESTRAAARRRQLDILRARRAETEATLAAQHADLADLAAEQTEATTEFAAAPSEEAVLRAGYALEAAARAVSTTLLAADNAARLADQRRGAHAERHARLAADAADLGLAAWLGRLDALSAATQNHRTALAGLWPTLRHAQSLAGQLALLREQDASADEAHSSLQTRRAHAAATEESARRRFETLRDTHGQTVAAILARHAAALAAVAEIKKELSATESARLARTSDHSAAERDLAAAEDKRTTQDALRRDAIARLRELAAQRLLAEAAPGIDAEDADEPWSVAHAVALARELDSRLAATSADPADWRLRQDRIHNHITELRDRLVPHGHQPETHQLDDLVLVRCLFQARPHTMTELQAAFAAEIEARDRLLLAREREIIENHLLAEVAVELQKLIRAAEAWRADANQELHDRPTSTGVRFRFQWEADTEIRFHEIRPILLRKGELWTPVERAAVATFLQGRIAAEQSADESGSWRDHLARALDYRRWHRFVIERQQEGQWRRLNKTTYGTGSGGEKALALTLPRFAAAAAHYRGASPLAPRLVMLDEAFAGIDPTMRAQCLGVLAQFDLDVVMTSELEWGCYATVPALAIYHLTTLPGLDAVASTRWLWNGREKRQTDHPDIPVAPPATDPADSTPPNPEPPDLALTS